MRVFAPVGNGRVLAYVLGGRKDTLSYVRGTNVLRVISREGETRCAAVGDELRSMPRGEGWPPEFDPPPLAGATRATIVQRIPDLTNATATSEDDAVPDVYARSVLVIAQHHDRSGSFMSEPGDDVLLAHALDICGERGAAEAFFEWALENRVIDGALMWGLEQHLRWSRSDALRERYERVKDGPGPELAATPPAPPKSGPAAMLWRAWQDAKSGRRKRAVTTLKSAVARRSPLDLFLTKRGIDLPAHAVFLLATHALLPAIEGGEDFFFEDQGTVQGMRRARALYGGAFHAGMPELGLPPRLGVEVREDLDVISVALETADGAQALNIDDPGRWSGPPPTTERYRMRVQLRDHHQPPLWASDSDPRPGGQEFSFEANPAPPVDWIHDAICYHVMVDRFARPGGSLPAPGRATALFGGTLDGIREHLDHISGLGCNVLWISPVHVSPTHHGYDQDDHFVVEPRYGGEAALTRLVEEAHDREMRVILDYVPNHTGRSHPLFKDAIRLDADAGGFYRFWQWPHYYRCFFDVISLPELDTGSRRVQEYMVRVAQHWLSAYGIDGLRCDHVAGVDPAFWIELRRGVRAVKADALILGEATGTPQLLARYAGRMDAIFDFFFAHMVREAVARGRIDAGSFERWLDQHERAFPGLALATLLDNHDMNRFLWMSGGDKRRLKLAGTLLMTLPGTPVIYYGTEVGVTQRHDGVTENAEARLPMLWGAEQDSDLLQHFQRLGRMRRDSVALRRGTRRTVLADSEVFVYEREASGERVLVALNFSDQPQRRELPGSGSFELPPLGWAVVDGSGRDRLRQDDVLGMGPDKRPG